jgi:hypothetical protein
MYDVEALAEPYWQALVPAIPFRTRNAVVVQLALPSSYINVAFQDNLTCFAAHMRDDWNPTRKRLRDEASVSSIVVSPTKDVPMVLSHGGVHLVHSAAGDAERPDHAPQFRRQIWKLGKAIRGHGVG